MDQTQNRVIVLGGLGFIGSQLIAKLLEQSYEIINIDKSLPQLVKIHPNVKEYLQKNKERNIQIDLAVQKNVKEVWEQLKISSNDIIVNCASETRWGMTKEMYDDRVRMNVFDKLSRQGIFPYFVPDNQCCVIFHNHQLKETEIDGRSQNQIGISKLEAEQEIIQMKELNYTILRPSIVYGPGDNGRITKMTLITTIYNFLGEEQKLLWSGDLKFNTVHIYDVCDAIILCFKNKKSFQQIYNLSSSDTTLNDVYSVITNVIPCEISFIGKVKSFFIHNLGLADILNRFNAKHLITYETMSQTHLCGYLNELSIDLALYEEELQQVSISVNGEKIGQDLGFKYSHEFFNREEFLIQVFQNIKYGILPNFIVKIMK